MKDEKHTVLAVTKKELLIIWNCLDTTADELLYDLNCLDLTNSSALILSAEHDAVIKLKLKIKADFERRFENEA
tara:strand:- start:191 stop:412 length:222 start_codon:yes stop_codon:yes gene_type:complete